jgi:hypothetical protein
MRLARAILALAFLATGSAAWGQGALLQGGATTPGHAPMYVGQGNSQPVVQDSGAAGGGGNGLGLSELLQVNRGTGTGPLGAHNCFYDNPTTNPAGYHWLCIDANAQGGALLATGAGGAASTIPLAFNVNGVAYQFPFSIGGVVGPSVSVVSDAACWNNTVGTLLKDCGAFVTVGGTNVWTGLNNFTGTFQIGTTTQTFPASGNIVGTSDTQSLTNKSIVASEINSGTLPTTVMPGLTGDVTSSAGAVATTIAANAVTNAKLAQGVANTVKANGTGSTANFTDFAMPSCSASGDALQWLTSTGFQCGSVAGTSAGWGLSLTSTVFSVSTTQPPYGFDVPINLGLTASASGSALTINLTGANGSAPSSSNPVSIPFRSTTLATGTPVWTAVTGALSIVVNSGATLGTSNSVPFRVWIFAEYNGGTPELGVAVCSSATQIYPCTSWETNRVTSTTITGLAASSGVLYATTGNSSDAVRIIGYCDYASGLATAGAWASSCTTLQLMGPGVKKPGDVIQRVTASTTTAGTSTSTTYVALTSGTTIAITPTASMDLIKVEMSGTINNSSNGAAAVQMSRGVVAATNLIGPVAANDGAIIFVPASMWAYDLPGVVTATTYAIQGKVTTGTVSFPTSGDQAVFSATEIMGALDKPANDNGSQEQRMTG